MPKKNKTKPKKKKKNNIATERTVSTCADGKGDFGFSAQSDGDETSSGFVVQSSDGRDAPVLHCYL